MRGNGTLPGAVAKSEGDDVWMLLLGCDPEDGLYLVSVLHYSPASPVGKLSEHNNAVLCQQEVATSREGPEVDNKIATT